MLRAGEGFLVTNMHNVRYLTGFTGSSGFVLVTKSGGVFGTDFRYREQALRETSGWEMAVEKGGRAALLKRLAGKLGLKRLCVESSVTYEFFRRLSAEGMPLRALSGGVERLRAVKDSGEMALIREAVRRAEAAFREVKPYIRAGARERAIALRLEERLKKMGCGRIPFGIIVASGENSAMPHAGATERKMAPGDLVVIDWGGEAGGYCSDMTRTLLIRGGRRTAGKREIYALVLEAGRRAVSSVAPGAEAGRLDGAARGVIEKAGYGRHFGHALGHGVGLEVHELPRIARGREGRIREGMVFTIEPGIYVPGLGGVRIEDMVAVGRRGAELLTSLPRGLEAVS
jgi:Xaa-Pro aminopeptidase